jgi:hypothetical protein
MEMRRKQGVSFINFARRKKWVIFMVALRQNSDSPLSSQRSVLQRTSLMLILIVCLGVGLRDARSSDGDDDALARDRTDPKVEARIDAARVRLGAATEKLYAAQRQMELLRDAVNPPIQTSTRMEGSEARVG